MRRTTLAAVCVLAINLPCSARGQQNAIPFPEALDAAAVGLDRIDSILDYSLLLGNGDINALVYSEMGQLKMMLTKNDVWDARLDSKLDPPLPTLGLIKRLLTGPNVKGGGRAVLLPEGCDWKGPDSYHAHPYPCPRPCARLTLGNEPTKPNWRPIRSEGKHPIDLKIAAAPTSRAKLDIHRAVACVQGNSHNLPKAEIRALADRNVFLVKATGDSELVPIPVPDGPDAASGRTDGVAWLTQAIPGDLDWPGMSFAVAVASKGDLKTVAIVTSREANDPLAAAVELARSTLRVEAAELIRRHEAEWQRFWSASGLKVADPLLENVWYRNLYFLRCVSKPGSISPGLFASLVNDRPAWHGDYHTNYNIQQTYWGAFAANHPELADPYDQLIREYFPRARWLAGKVFGMKGAYYPHVLFAYEPDPAKCKSPGGRQYIHHVWGFTLGVAGFTVQPVWWHYKYDPRPDLLEKIAYPAVRDVAIFQAEFLQQCESDGTVVLAPSVSPEHWGWTKDFLRNRDGTFDIAMFRYIFEAAIEGATTLQRDAELVAQWKQAARRLPPYPTTKTDPPIVVDMRDAPPLNYNLAVPAVPVFPGDVVTWWSPAAEKKLFARTIEGLRWNGNNSSIILSVARARLSMSGTFEWVHNELKNRQRPNGTTTLNVLGSSYNKAGHYTEQFAATMAVSELLLQSVGDVIRVFPAWPAKKDAQFQQLRAQGGFLVSADWKGGTVREVQITSLYGGPMRLLSPWPAIKVYQGDDKRPIPIKPDGRGIVRLDTKPGQRLRFEAK